MDTETYSIDDVTVKTHTTFSIVDFLQNHDYIVTHVKNNVYKIARENLEVFLNVDANNLFFELDTGSIQSLASEDFYKDLLDLNTEILPVSLALDTVSTSEPRLIIVESRERKNLDENEILAVLEAMEIALARLEVLVARTLEKSQHSKN